MKKLVPILLVFVVLALGCKYVTSLKDAASGGSAPGSSGGADPKADIAEASKKFIALPAFTAHMEGSGTQSAMKYQVEYAAPDKYHITYQGGTGAGMELIMIGTTTYTKIGGNWTKNTSDANNKIPSLRDSFTEEGLKKLTDAKFEGEETVDGKPALVYSYKNVTPAGDSPFSSKIWIGKQTGLPIKIVVDYTNGTLKQMTVSYDTETPVKIEPPIK